MFRAMVLKRLLGEVQRLENAMKKRWLLFVPVNPIKSNYMNDKKQLIQNVILGLLVILLFKTWTLSIDVKEMKKHLQVSRAHLMQINHRVSNVEDGVENIESSPRR